MLFWVLLLLSAPSLFADAPDVSQSLQQADSAYAQRADLAKAREALQAYERAILAGAGTEAYWKASRAAWWVADNAASRSEKLVTFQKGIDEAKAGLARDPNCVECHFWLGANYGSFGETKGILKSLSLVKPIRQEMAEVIRINDRFQGGGGYRVLGAMDYKVPAIAGGSKKRALDELNKALAIDPNDPFTHYYLAEFYQVTGDKAKMKAEWETMKSLKVSDDVKPEQAMLRAKGEKLFERR